MKSIDIMITSLLHGTMERVGMVCTKWEKFVTTCAITGTVAAVEGNSSPFQLTEHCLDGRWKVGIRYRNPHNRICPKTRSKIWAKEVFFI